MKKIIIALALCSTMNNSMDKKERETLYSQTPPTESPLQRFDQLNSSNNKTLPTHELTRAEEREQKLITQLGASVFFGALFVAAYVSACAIGS